MISRNFRYILVPIFCFISTLAIAQFENCNNGIDDDGDGDVDCFDSNCSSSPFCQSFESNCTDGIDNDGDGLPDCLDSDCRYSGVCPVESDCNNGIDDDGDGFFDYYDGDCLDSPDNPNTYITSVADCEVRPQGNVFEIEVEWQSEARSSGVYAIPTVADLDLDGIPEIISTNERGRSMTVLNGKDGSTLSSITFSNEVFVYPAVADVDNDGYGEIFVSERNGRIRAYNHDLTPYWPGSVSSVISDGRMMNIADFNQDGRAELYYVNEIRDAQNGQLIIQGTHNQGSGNQQWDNHLNGISVAVDILPDSYCTDCQGLELILGHIIYAVDIANGQLTEVLNMNNTATKVLVNPMNGFTYTNTDRYQPKKAQFGTQNFSSTSVVDLNEDGNLDVVLSGTLNNSQRGPSMVFFWDIANSSVRARLITRPFNKIPTQLRGNFRDLNGNTCGANDGECTWQRGMGTLNIANIDTDADLEITFMSGSSLYALDMDLNEEWANHDDFWETSSGFTGTTVFDFDGDGSSEVVYRDEIDLYIVDGTTGIPLNSKVSGTFCSSQTQAEYPVVADVDGDGETEIIVACGCQENTRDVLRTNNTRDCGFIRAYKAANNNYWVPARKLWNQTAYFNVNINDDLSIPRFQQPHHLSFAQKCALLGSGAPSFSLNKFYNQSPIINYCGNLTFPAPNLDFADNPVTVNPPVCPDDRFQVRLRFVNTGDEVAYRDVPISFYADDPANSYTDSDPNPHLETLYLNIPGGFQVGQLVDTTLWVNGKAGNFTLYISLNDIGPYDNSGSSLSNSVFYPLDSLNGIIRECDGTPTVVSAEVIPSPYNTTAVLLNDNDFCPGSVRSNGAITAHVAGDTVGFVFRWYAGSTANGAPLYIGATQKSLTGGTYTVVASHVTANCSGNNATVEVRDLASPPVIDAEVIAQQTSCDPNRPNGALRAFVLEGGSQVTAGYNFFWYRGANTTVPANSSYSGGPVAEQLSAGTYRLVVEHQITGCTSTMDMVIEENLIYPVVRLESKQNKTICDPANADGAASVSVDGNIVDYDFYWYSGNVASPDTSSSNVIARGNMLSGLSEGNFTVFAADKSTRCLSGALRINIEDDTWNPVVRTQLINPQQACDPALANGALQAYVDESSIGGSTNVVSGYSFDWFFGTFSESGLPAKPTTNGGSVSGLQEGNYTLLTTNSITGCQTINYVNLPAQKSRPQLDPAFSVQHANRCNAPWGSMISVRADGGKTSADGYTFRWRNISTGAILSETSEVLSNVAPGRYGVRVINPLGCVSTNETEIRVLDMAPKPQVNLQTVPNTSCLPGQPNGMLIAAGFSGNSSEYTFEWFYNSPSGAAVESTKIASSGDTLRFLAAGRYALRMTSSGSMCGIVAYANVATQNSIFPSLDTLYTQATTDCRPAFANGEVAFFMPTGKAQVPPEFTEDRNYTFELYAGNTVSGLPLQSNETGLFGGLNTGDFTAIVRDNYNHCSSAPMTVFVEKAPGISISLDTFVPSSACASADGSLGVTVSSLNNNNPGGVGYTFQWYYRAAGDPLPGSANPGTMVSEDAFSSARTDLPSGFYLIEVYDNFSNCQETFEFYLPNADPPQVSNSNIVNASQCSPGNGSLEIDAFSPAITLDNYEVILYQSSTVDPAAQLQIWVPGSANNDNHVFGGLEPGDYTLAFRENFGGNCFSTIEQFTIPNATPEAIISFAKSPDYSCNSNGTGQIEVSEISRNGISEDLNGFSYTWYPGLSTSGTPVGTGRVTPANLSAGNYTVLVTDTNGSGMGCSYTQSVYLENQPLTLDIDGVSFSPNTICSTDNATIYVNAITENGIPVSLGGYGLQLLDENFNTPAVFTGSGIVSDPFSGLADGTYYVLATNLSTSCEVLSQPVNIQTETYQPVVSLISDFPDFSCSGGVPTGELSVSATSPADGDIQFFQFAWYDSNGILLTNGSSISGLAAGEYTVVVTDLAGPSEGCSFTAIFEVLEGTREINFTLAGRDPDYCDPVNGEIYVESITESYFHNGNAITQNMSPSDYTFNLMDVDLATLTNAGAGIQADPFRQLEEGAYWITANNMNTDNCISTAVGYSLESQCIPPQIDIVLNRPQYSQNPDPSSWTGSLSADVRESPYNPVDSASNNFTYSYEWYRAEDYMNTGGNGSSGSGTAGGSGPIGTGSSIDGLNAGEYVLVVRNNVTGAVSTVTYKLESVYIEPVLTAHGNPQTVCYPDGNIALDGITFDGETDDPSRYTVFLFADSNLSVLRDSVSVNQPGATLFSELTEGNYYLQIRHDAYFVRSSVLEVSVDNISTAPVIDLDIANLRPQISCQPDILATGQLSVISRETDGTSDTYRYQWYEGNQAVSQNFIAGADQALISELNSGFYTVEVYNTVTQCSSVRTFFVEEQLEIPQVEVSSTPATVCDPSLADGSVSAKVVQAGNYSFAWYSGNSTAGEPVHRGTTWGGLMPGTYTVVATDMITGTCLSLPMSVQVEDASALPEVSVITISENTACDNSLSNGVLSANVSGSISSYSFRWFDGSGQLINEDAASISNLAEGSYRVEVLEKSSGCINEAWGTISLRPIQHPLPTVSLGSHMTNCAAPDGSATVIMGEENESFVFNWFYEDGSPLIQEQIQINENDLSSTAVNLIAGTYYVEAYDLSTGCYSPKARIEIEDHSYVPAHMIETKAASCELNDGSLTVIPTEKMVISRIAWTHLLSGQTFESQYSLKDAPAGEYDYEILWSNGCRTFGTTFLSADLNVFNGLSPNDDGENDYFHIDCIEQFPANMVKVFNRAGALVYEGQAYNNVSVVFEGTGNRGIYVGGQELPDGTYFYVIEKNDGSQPLTGYVELSR